MANLTLHSRPSSGTQLCNMCLSIGQEGVGITFMGYRSVPEHYRDTLNKLGKVKIYQACLHLASHISLLGLTIRHG